MPAVYRVPLGPRLMEAPLPPIEVLKPDLLTFSLNPEKRRIDLRNLNPIPRPN